jgi:two-component system NtrC family sensor kinase
MEPVRQPVDVNRLVEETLQFLENEALHRNIRIHVERDPSAPEVVSDGAQLQQVLLNILNNAIDAVGRDGQVWVTTQFDPAAREVRVQVADSGPGIPSEILGKIFDPFFTTKKLGSGTGLGLSICHSILTNLGGRIEAANRAEGGAVFTVSVPVNDLRA